MCHDELLDLRCLLSGRHRAPSYEYKVLFVSKNLNLLKFLKDRLKPFDCFVDYCPAAWLARTLLEHDIYYTLCVFDDLPDATGAELVAFTRALAHRQSVPIILVKELVKEEARA